MSMTRRTDRTLAHIAPMPYHAFDEHSGAHLLRAAPALMSPFIGIDSFTLPQPFFGPHPHAGMSAVTLMLPESEGGLVNRDSLGDHSVIRPGDLHWTQAGRGMMHEEVPAAPGRATRGLQVFVNLARRHKQADPVAFRVDRDAMPSVPVAGGQVRVVAGEFNGHASPIAADARWLTRVTMLDITLDAGASLAVPVAEDDNAFFALHAGSVVANARTLREPVALLSARDGNTFVLQAGDQALRGVLFSGTPIDEPIVAGGPFVGNDMHDITAYRQAFARGAMGALAKSV
jgi:redox-sensitive bicupin YhaK (pirin superfamily)